MKNDSCVMNGRKFVGVARAWGAYIRMLALSIIARQVRIAGLVKSSGKASG
jgi:hypothetical protein